MRRRSLLDEALLDQPVERDVRRLLALDLVVLEDDREYFPKYNVSLVVRDEVMEEYPQIEELFGPVTEELTDEVLLELNAKVDVEGQEPADVAFDWLVAEGFIEE